MKAIFAVILYHMSFLSVQHITGYNEGRLTVEDVSFEQQRFENIAIAGETGSGKTSLLKMIGGLMQPASGKILLNNERVIGPDEQLIAGHKKIAYLSQHFELRNNYRVEELLDMANKIGPDEAGKIYEICSITHLLRRWSDELSGGEKQRVSLARLLTTAPELLLLDEPYSNLDMLHKQQMKDVVNAAQRETGFSCLLVSHDALDILSWANTVFFMKNGHIIQKGKPEQLYNNPVNEYAAALLGSYNLIDTSLISDWKGPAYQNKKLFFRPQQASITNVAGSGIQGTVNKILYWGSYYTIDVIVGTQLVSVQTPEHNVELGDKIGLLIHTKDSWSL